MVQPGRQEHQLAAQRETPPSRLARYKALSWARDQFEGSLAQSFLQRLKVLDFAKQAVQKVSTRFLQGSPKTPERPAAKT